MLALIAIISISVGVISYRYRTIKTKETVEKINRPDLIQMRRAEHD